MIYVRFIFVALFFSSSIGDQTGTIVPCKKGDDACVLTSAKSTLKKFIQGYPDFGVEPSDPLPLEEIVGDLSTLKFKFTDSTAVGFKNCDIDDYVNLDLDNMKLKVNLVCTDVIMSGHYNIKGQLIILPVEGDGKYTIHCKKYLFKLDADLKQTEGGDGKKHLSVKNFKFVPEAKEPVIFDFQNLFNGQKDLADGVLKFANENWKEVAEFVQEPVIAALLKKVVKNFNKFLKVVSIEDLYLA